MAGWGGFWDDSKAHIYTNQPFGNFNFTLTVEAAYDIPIKAVHSFQKKNEYEYIQEGGLNDYVHMRRKPISQPFTFEVERYVTEALVDPLSNGTELTLPIILWAEKYHMDNGDSAEIVSNSASGKLFVFTGPIVTGIQYNGWDAEKSGLLTQNITIAYNSLYVVSNYADIWK